MRGEPPLTVLVLGVGGQVSQGIVKALRMGALRVRVVGACVDALGAGLFAVDEALVSPYAADATFTDWLVDTVRHHAVDAVLSGVEEVLEVLSRHRDEVRRETGAVCIVGEPGTLAVGNDKLKTCEWLAENGFAYPAFAAATDTPAVAALAADCGFPLVAKPRRGKGSTGFMVLEDERDLEWAKGRAGYVVQQLVGSANGEYTIGCLCDSDGALHGSIAMRRWLAGGTSVRMEVEAAPAALTEAEAIVARLAPQGPCNVQLRQDGPRAVCLEINPRFSGTTAVRAKLGFNDVEAALRHFVMGEPMRSMPRVTHGTAVRYWNEVYVGDASTWTAEFDHSLG